METNKVVKYIIRAVYSNIRKESKILIFITLRFFSPKNRIRVWSGTNCFNKNH